MHDNILAAIAALKVVVSVSSSNVDQLVITMIFFRCNTISKTYNSKIVL